MGFWDSIGNGVSDIGAAVGLGSGRGPNALENYTDPSKAFKSQAPDLGNVNQSRAGLAALAGQYGDLAAGKGPSLAAMQTQAGLAQNQAQTLGTIAQAGRGANPGALAALAGQQTAQTGQATANAGAQLALQQQLGAMGAQGGLLGSNQSADLQAAQLAQNNTQFNATQGNQLALQQNQQIAAAEQARKQALLKLLAGAGSAGSSAAGSLATGPAGMAGAGASAGGGAGGLLALGALA